LWKKGANSIMNQNDILARGTTSLQPFTHRILPFGSTCDHTTNLIQAIAIYQLSPTEGDIRRRNNKVNGRDLGMNSKTQQRLYQNRLIAQPKILFPGVTANSAAATGSRDQNMNIHKVILTGCLND
jgi:hypothetical protein